MRFGMLVCLSLCLGIAAYGGEATSTPEQFNIECPAVHLCPNLERYYQACKQTHQLAECDAFVATFRKLTPKYDCQRSFDHTPTADYTVPAVWVCKEIQEDRPQRAVLEEYIELLRKLKSNDARHFFASAEFRNVLDGYLAEEHRDASLRAERYMNLQNIVSRSTLIESLPTIESVLQVPPGAFAISLRGGTVRVYHFNVNGVNYFVDTRSEDDVVTGISTTDSKFRTREGIRVGDSWSKVKGTGAKALIDESGNCYPQLPSGWRAVFDINGEKTCDHLPAELKVLQLNLEGQPQQ